MTKAYENIYYSAPDGLRLYARDYGAVSDRSVILCMHGLTRNSADFHNLALHLQNRFRVISVDQRGRGLSGYDDDPNNYRPDVYCSDMFALLDHLNLKSVVAIGTSMGGLMTMMMATAKPAIFEAAIINDIGPEIDPAGLARIKSYVGGSQTFKSWTEAEAALKAQGPEIFPDYSEQDWADFARRTCQKNEDGSVRFAYDPAISEPFKSDDNNAAPPDLWPVFDALDDTPTLIIRGASSDILSPATVAKMCSRLKDCSSVEIPRIGHAPLLDEAESLAAIDKFLEALS